MESLHEPEAEIVDDSRLMARNCCCHYCCNIEIVAVELQHATKTAISLCCQGTTTDIGAVVGMAAADSGSAYWEREIRVPD